jgi:AcrR family transcriptional regulator
MTTTTCEKVGAMKKAKRPRRRDAGRARGQPIVEAVLRATLEELATSGPEGLSVERVAQRAQVNKTSVYRRWPTRAALVAAALEQTASELGDQLDRPEAEHPEGLVEELTSFVMQVAERMESAGGKALLRAAMQQDAAPPLSALSESLAALGQLPGGDFERRASSRGEWRRGLKTEQVLFVGALLHRTFLEHAPITRAWARGLVELLNIGIQPRQTTR